MKIRLALLLLIVVAAFAIPVFGQIAPAPIAAISTPINPDARDFP